MSEGPQIPSGVAMLIRNMLGISPDELREKWEQLTGMLSGTLNHFDGQLKTIAGQNERIIALLDAHNANLQQLLKELQNGRDQSIGDDGNGEAEPDPAAEHVNGAGEHRSE